MYKLIMTIDFKIRDEKLQYGINREAPKSPASSSGKIDKYEYLIACEETLLSDQSKTIEQAKFATSLLGKNFSKANKNN